MSGGVEPSVHELREDTVDAFLREIVGSYDGVSYTRLENEFRVMRGGVCRLFVCVYDEGIVYCTFIEHASSGEELCSYDADTFECVSDCIRRVLESWD